MRFSESDLRQSRTNGFRAAKPSKSNMARGRGVQHHHRSHFYVANGAQHLGGKNLGALAAMGLVAVLCFYVVYRKQISLDLVMANRIPKHAVCSSRSTRKQLLHVRTSRRHDCLCRWCLRKTFSSFNYSDSMALEGLFAESASPRTTANADGRALQQ